MLGGSALAPPLYTFSKKSRATCYTNRSEARIVGSSDAIVAAEYSAGDTGRKQAKNLLSRHSIRITLGGRPKEGEQEATREQFLAAIDGAESGACLFALQVTRLQKEAERSLE